MMTKVVNISEEQINKVVSSKGRDKFSVYSDIGYYRLFKKPICKNELFSYMKYSFNLDCNKVVPTSNIDEHCFRVLRLLVQPGADHYFKYYSYEHDYTSNTLLTFYDGAMKMFAEDSYDKCPIGTYILGNWFTLHKKCRGEVRKILSSKGVTLYRLADIFINNAISVIPVGTLKDYCKYHTIYPYSEKSVWYFENQLRRQVRIIKEEDNEY